MPYGLDIERTAQAAVLSPSPRKLVLLHNPGRAASPPRTSLLMLTHVFVQLLLFAPIDGAERMTTHLSVVSWVQGQLPPSENGNRLSTTSAGIGLRLR